MVPFDQVLATIQTQAKDFPNYHVRPDYLKSLYFYASMLPEDATVVEIGTLYGCSLVTMAAALKGNWSIVGIDPVLNGTFNYPDCHRVDGHTFTSSYARVFKLAEDCGIQFSRSDAEKTGIITLYGQRSWEILELSGTKSWELDLVLIDGEHTYEAIKKDLQWGNLIKLSGLLVLDDYMDFVERAMREYMDQTGCWNLVHESNRPKIDNYIVTLLQKKAQ